MKEYDVAIVGLGPVGATLACLLCRYNTLSIACIEATTHVNIDPRAGALDADGLRILRDAGLSRATLNHVLPLDVCLSTHTPPHTLSTKLRIPSSLSAPHSPPEEEGGYPRVAFFFQPHIERNLRDILNTSPTNSPDLYLGTRVTDLVPRPFPELSTLVCTNQPGDRVEIRAKVVVGADGGSSSIRRLSGICMEGPSWGDEKWLVLDLADVPPEWRSGAVDGMGLDSLNTDFHFLCSPSSPTGVQLPLPFGHIRMEFAYQDGMEDRLLELTTMRGFSFPSQEALESCLVRSAVYVFHAKTAPTFVSPSGSTVLVGDAAHLLPPFGGQGLVSGLRDASALAYRIWALLHPSFMDLSVSPAILQEYSDEARSRIHYASLFARGMSMVVRSQSSLVQRVRDLVLYLASYAPLATMITRPGPSIGTSRGSTLPALPFDVAWGRSGKFLFLLPPSTDVVSVTSSLPPLWKDVVVCYPHTPRVSELIGTRRLAILVVRPDRVVLGLAFSIHDALALIQLHLEGGGGRMGSILRSCVLVFHVVQLVTLLFFLLHLFPTMLYM